MLYDPRLTDEIKVSFHCENGIKRIKGNITEAIIDQQIREYVFLQHVFYIPWNNADSMFPPMLIV